jgi:hypothetical protein
MGCSDHTWCLFYHLQFRLLFIRGFPVYTLRPVDVFTLGFLSIYHVSYKSSPDVNKGEGQLPSAHHTIGGRPLSIFKSGGHSQEIVPSFNNNFCRNLTRDLNRQIVLRLLYVYEFVNTSHELFFSILDALSVANSVTGCCNELAAFFGNVTCLYSVAWCGRDTTLSTLIPITQRDLMRIAHLITYIRIVLAWDRLQAYPSFVAFHVKGIRAVMGFSYAGDGQVK